MVISAELSYNRSCLVDLKHIIRIVMNTTVATTYSLRDIVGILAMGSVPVSSVEDADRVFVNGW